VVLASASEGEHCKNAENGIIVESTDKNVPQVVLAETGEAQLTRRQMLKAENKGIV
jgi:hypothetical protein